MFFPVCCCPLVVKSFCETPRQEDLCVCVCVCVCVCAHAHTQLLQSYLTLCDPMDCMLPGSSVHGIPQARILEWVAISSSRGIFLTKGLIPSLWGLLNWQVDSLLLVPPVKPQDRPKHSPLYFSLVAQMVKNLPAMWETQVWSCIGKIPWRREWQSTPVFLPGESHG